MRLAAQIHELEGLADAVHRRALAALFDGSDADARIDPLTVMKWRDVFERLEQTTDLCKQLAALFEAIVLENA
jgi:uncharacterized protein